MEHVNAEILRAIADGKKVQYRDTTSSENCDWKDFGARFIEECFSVLTGTPKLEWRIAPKTIKIGDIEVPEPCRVAPKAGQKFWTLTPFGGAAHFTWDGTNPCYDALEGGFVHLTEEAARQYCEAIKSLLKEQK